MNFLHTIQEQHQDGVIWKASNIWKKALNPDLAVKSQEEIVSLLLCIPNAQKRSQYVNRIVQLTVDLVKENDDKIDDLAESIKNIDGQLKKLLKKNNPDEEMKALIASLQEDRSRLEDDQKRLKNSTLPKIEQKDLTKQLKEEREARDKKARQLLEKKNINSRDIKLESLGLPLDFDGDPIEVIRFQIYARMGKYWSKRGEDVWEEISNFTMRIINFVDTGIDVAYRLIAVKNVYGHEKIIVLNTDDLTSVGTFKKVLQRHGSFSFKGNDIDLTRLAEFLQKDEAAAARIDVLGYHPKGKFYAYSNGVVDCADPDNNMTFYPVDEYGIVTIRDRSYFIPANSKMYAEKEDSFTSEKLFVYTENKSINFASWSKLHRLVYKDYSVIAQMWVISALFRDAIKSIREINVTPILNLYGQRSSGKTQFAESLMVLGGYSQPAIGLGSVSTPKGFLRKFAQYKNWIVWLEEYKNNINKQFIEAIKNIFDGIPYTRAEKSMGYDTNAVPVNSACLLAGQEMPIVEPALYSRVIMLAFKPGKEYTDEERLNFKRLKNIEGGGLSSIACEILKTRPTFLENFRSHYDRVFKELRGKINNPAMDDRFILSISIMAAIRCTLDGMLPFSFTIEEALDILVRNMTEQFAVMEGNDDLGKWWQIVENLMSQRLLKAGENFGIKDGQLHLRLNDAYGQYLKELGARRDNNMLGKSTLDNYLKNDTASYVGYGKVRIKKGYEANSDWCHSFKLKVLEERYGIDLSHFNTVDSGTSADQPPGPFSPGETGDQWEQWSNSQNKMVGEN